MSKDTERDSSAGAELPPSVPTPWYFVHGRRAHAIDRQVLRHTGFSFVSWQAARLRSDPTLRALLLTTIGRRSGMLHEHALSYTCRGGTIVLLGSNSGGPTDPAWAHNLRAEPRCWVRVDRRDYAALARIALGEERSSVIEDLLPKRPHASVYEARTRAVGREMPVFLVELASRKPPVR